MLIVPFFLFIALLCLLGTPGFGFDGSFLAALLLGARFILALLPFLAVTILPICFLARLIENTGTGREMLWFFLTALVVITDIVLMCITMIAGFNPWFGRFLAVTLAYIALSLFILKPS